MPHLILRLDPEFLQNPDLDIRYVLPDLLAARSGGVVQADGYDYVVSGEYPPGARPLLLYLTATDLDAALAHVRAVIEHERVLDNDLRGGVVVAVERQGSDEVVYPPGFIGKFER